MVAQASAPGGETRAIVGRTATGACAFHDGRARRCAIQRDAGIALLPSACRNFPRVALRDPRGLFVALSHYCPTAARLLLDAHQIAIVEAPPGLSLDGAVEGLDATGVMPPLLRPGMLMDFEGYGAWEREAIDLMNVPAYSPRRALAAVAEATADAMRWSPGGEPLAARVRHAFARVRHAHDRDDPPGFLPQARKAFVASHLFASWSAYQHGGLSAVVESAREAGAVLDRELEGADSVAAFIDAVRATDFRLRHVSSVPAHEIARRS
jgi:hypothetical protein